jgi:hypothetical protein
MQCITYQLCNEYRYYFNSTKTVNVADVVAVVGIHLFLFVVSLAETRKVFDCWGGVNKGVESCSAATTSRKFLHSKVCPER